MSLRTKLNSHPLITGGVVVVIIVVALLLSGAATPVLRPKVLPMYLTTDNGATWFESKTGELPPVKQSDGKIAVRVYLFKCGDGKPFVGYLEKYTDEAKAVLEGAKTVDGKPNMADLPKLQAASMRGLLAKRPTDKDWSHNVSTIRSIACPDKTPAAPVLY